ncbi:uncharacterized protein LOC107479757 isoform X2 [Arachis duranensis]|uniref:Uncharacterized protein LOC107479757 isoform X2 n=1 Tax=Arachis duranensis TaxID=130453 RepID=A0A9C6WQS6_ARADU|nr:uncharacterized protein LOC107479757 isoform X2 [Arachis duranensis]
MTSVQCYKTCQETCYQQKTQSSIGQKVSEMCSKATTMVPVATHAQQHCHGSSNHHIGATQTHTISQCHGGSHHSGCSHFHAHTQGYGAANHHSNGAGYGGSLHKGCTQSHTHTQACGGANHHNNGGIQSQCHGSNKTNMTSHSGGGYVATNKTTETDYYHSQTKTTANSGSGRCSNGRSKKEHKSRGMFQKIKDGLSGRNSDCSSSESDSSESDSDNENNCGRRSRKNCN